MKVEITTRGVAKAVADIAGLGVRARDPQPIGPEVAAVVNRSTERRFESRGPGWPPLADETEQRKTGSEPLVDSGRLKSAMTHQAAKQTDQDELTVSSQQEPPYARFHQYGTKRMPKREIVELRPSEQRQVAKLVERYVAKGKP